MPLKSASLFSGIGGFDLPADWMGWETVFTCEINPFGRQVLQYYWPNAICYGNIKETDFSIHRGQIDILSGGFPCQPFSISGKRLGKEDDRHLWPEMLRAIREISPRWVVGENVRGLVNWNGGLVFDEVQADLEAEGYEVWAFLIPACGVNAPHRRDRIWFVAKNTHNDAETRLIPNTNECAEGSSRTGSKTKGTRSRNNDEQDCGGESPQQHLGCSDVLRTPADSFCERTRLEEPNSSDEGGGLSRASESTMVRCGYGEANAKGTTKFSEYENATNPRNSGLQGGEINGSVGDGRKKSDKQSPRLILPTWGEFPTQSPVCTGDDGFSIRLDNSAIQNLLEGKTPREPWIPYNKWRQESIKAYGNAVVPQVVYQIYKAIMAVENSNNK